MILSRLASILFYLFIFSSIFLFAFLYNKTGKKFFGTISILVPAIALALRYGVGTDSMAYADMFDQVASEESPKTLARLTTFSMEPTALISIVVLSRFAFGHCAFFFFYSVTTFLCLFLFAQRIDKKHDWLLFGALSLIMLPYSLNAMRQSAAVSLFSLLLIRLIKNPKATLSNIFIFVLAIAFHFSAFLLAPILFVPFLQRRLGTKKTALLISCFTAIALVVFPKIITYALNNEYLPDKYANTLELYDTNLLNFDFAIFLVLSACLFLTKSRNNSFSSQFNNYIFLIILCNLFYAGLGFFSAYIGRMSDYFWPSAVIAIWAAIDRFKDSPRFKYAFYILVLASYFILVYLIMGNSQILPYRFLS